VFGVQAFWKDRRSSTSKGRFGFDLAPLGSSLPQKLVEDRLSLGLLLFSGGGVGWSGVRDSVIVCAGPTSLAISLG